MSIPINRKCKQTLIYLSELLDKQKEILNQTNNDKELFYNAVEYEKAEALYMYYYFDQVKRENSSVFPTTVLIRRIIELKAITEIITKYNKLDKLNYRLFKVQSSYSKIGNKELNKLANSYNISPTALKAIFNSPNPSFLLDRVPDYSKPSKTISYYKEVFHDDFLFNAYLFYSRKTHLNYISSFLKENPIIRVRNNQLNSIIEKEIMDEYYKVMKDKNTASFKKVMENSSINFSDNDNFTKATRSFIKTFGYFGFFPDFFKNVYKSQMFDDWTNYYVICQIVELCSSYLHYFDLLDNGILKKSFLILFKDAFEKLSIFYILLNDSKNKTDKKELFEEYEYYSLYSEGVFLKNTIELLKDKIGNYKDLTNTIDQELAKIKEELKDSFFKNENKKVKNISFEDYFKMLVENPARNILQNDKSNSISSRVENVVNALVSKYRPKANPNYYFNTYLLGVSFSHINFRSSFLNGNDFEYNVILGLDLLNCAIEECITHIGKFINTHVYSNTVGADRDFIIHNYDGMRNSYKEYLTDFRTQLKFDENRILSKEKEDKIKELINFDEIDED